ncbi:hypothetical protein K3X41_05875 [Aliiroseovarius crassostreae]|uniref:hypothetical protein n=1 Tax=Aliiroseovarius crassostreae TaxID=154981 RepID=UPI0021FF9B1A|nr:hypothetical protein [Aliiroseovarius crassostreae]UWQ09115.1 hypothetical protein K3X25_06020 [Aliiroseovarius crassostreae]UWQ12192.1 hypothetical protein K3X41_05875 [Aliiroseovarius crassostreae]
MNDRADIPKLVDLARDAHAESRFSYIPFSADKIRKIAERATEDEKRHAVMLAEKDCVPVGFAYCSVGEYHIGTDVLRTTIHNINVSRDVRMTLSGGRVAMGLFRGIET